MRSKDKMLFLNQGIIWTFFSKRNYLTLCRGRKGGELAELKFDLDMSNKGGKSGCHGIASDNGSI